MNKIPSNDPRSVRARQALHEALIDLLKEKHFSNISVTDIAGKAGLARHTFYNHYETKEDLLYSLIDSVLDEFFLTAEEWNVSWNMVTESLETDRKVGIEFFKTWQKHPEVVEILNMVDIDSLLIARLKEKFEQFLQEFRGRKGLDIGPDLGRYFITFNAYAFAGVLRQWFKDGMKYSPEVMGEFLNHFAGVALKRTAIEKFRGLIR